MTFQTIPWNGKPVAFPGLYGSIPIDRYHSAECCIEASISSSGLRKIFSESPAHYWCESPLNPDREDDETATKSMILGQATHHLLLGEKRFKDRFVVRPDTIGGEKWHGSRNSCKIWLKDQAAKNLTVITADMVVHIRGMAKSLASEPLIKAGILNGRIEQSLIWKDLKTGVWLKARPDAIPGDSLDFADIKTTTSVMWDALQRTIRDYGYYQQGALIAEGCEHVLKTPINSFTLIFVESKPPYCVEIVTLKDVDIQRGMKANRAALNKFAECYKTGVWPGPRGVRADARFIELNEFDQKKIDAKLAGGL